LAGVQTFRKRSDVISIGHGSFWVVKPTGPCFITASPALSRYGLRHAERSRDDVHLLQSHTA